MSDNVFSCRWCSGGFLEVRLESLLARLSRNLFFFCRVQVGGIVSDVVGDVVEGVVGVLGVVADGIISVV